MLSFEKKLTYGEGKEYKSHVFGQNPFYLGCLSRCFEDTGSKQLKNSISFWKKSKKPLQNSLTVNFESHPERIEVDKV